MDAGDEASKESSGDGGDGFHLLNRYDAKAQSSGVLGLGGLGGDGLGAEFDGDGDEGRPSGDEDEKAEGEEEPGTLEKEIGHEGTVEG